MKSTSVNDANTRGVIILSPMQCYRARWCIAKFSFWPVRCSLYGDSQRIQHDRFDNHNFWRLKVTYSQKSIVLAERRCRALQNGRLHWISQRFNEYADTCFVRLFAIFLAENPQKWNLIVRHTEVKLFAFKHYCRPVGSLPGKQYANL